MYNATQHLHHGEPQSKNTVYASTFATVLAVGFPLNAIALWILLHRHSHKSPSAVFMINLAISDLLLAISLPWRIYFFATGTWPLGHMACNFINMLFLNNIRSSSVFITFISMDRLLAVVYPLRSRHIRNGRNAWKAAVVVWLIVILLNIPESVKLLDDLRHMNKSICFDNHGENPLARSPIRYLQPFLVLSLLMVNVVSTLMVLITLRKHVSVSAKVENKVNVMLIFLMNLTMFTIFFLPVSFVILFKNFSRAITPLLCLASINCCFDPLLYYFSFDGFWKKNEDGGSS